MLVTVTNVTLDNCCVVLAFHRRRSNMLCKLVPVMTAARHMSKLAEWHALDFLVAK